MSGKKTNVDLESVTRLLLGLVFIGVGVFSLASRATSLVSMTDDLFNLTNIVGVTLIIFGILIIIRSFTKL